jgi:hypothetical protein
MAMHMESREAADGKSLSVALRSPIRTTIRRGFVKMGKADISVGR